MRTLLELQKEFAQAVLADPAAGFSRLLRAHELAGEDQLAVYRNNVLHNLTEALRDLYPVVLKLTGEDWFRQAAHAFIHSHASHSGDLNDYGREFADYLAGLQAVTDDLPYLPDTARLEWQVHEAFHAADAGALELQRLAGVPPHAYSQLCFHLHPACRLLQSAYPVQRIWQVNQPGYTGQDRVNLEEGGAALLVFRAADYTIGVEALDAMAFSFITDLQRGLSLSAIADTLPEGVDIGALLQSLVARGIVVDFSEEAGAC
ncbi:MAG: DNA-binding domain-containing protein [Thiobacillaceae bacterium]|jgi:hypothetical protein